MLIVVLKLLGTRLDYLNGVKVHIGSFAVSYLYGNFA